MAKKDEGSIAVQIRKAFKKGQKTILLEVDGKEHHMKIEKVTKPVTFTAGGEQHKRKESWLLVTKVDGSFTPVFSVEPVEGCNIRSKF